MSDNDRIRVELLIDQLSVACAPLDPRFDLDVDGQLFAVLYQSGETPSWQNWASALEGVRGGNSNIKGQRYIAVDEKDTCYRLTNYVEIFGDGEMLNNGHNLAHSPTTIRFSNN